MLSIASITPLQVVGAAIATSGLYLLGRCIYILYLHPLAKFPGPKLAALSDAWWAWMFTSGRGAQIMLDVHRKYGDVVRIAPNELSFSSVQSYFDIYGHAGSKSRAEGRFLKTEFYDLGAPRINTVRDPVVHARQRKALSHAFSAKALRDQEDVVQQYVDLFVKQLTRLGSAGKKAIEATEAYNWLTFDIIGDLAFGESFNAVADAKTHFWIAQIFDATQYMLVQQVIKRVPLLKYVESFLVPKGSGEKLQIHTQLSHDKALKRMQLGPDLRPGKEDFFGHMIRKGTITETEIAAQARVLILAGSETTATALSAITYYLLRNPACLAEVQKEVRGRFKAMDEITGDSAAGLKYVHGVIEEGLRLSPPVGSGLPRHSPGAVVDGHYVPAGVIVTNGNYEMARDPRYWHDPEAFRPERWIGEGYHDDKRASQPFSTGSRGCLGLNLAYLELRIIVAKIVFAFDFELESKHLGDWNDECKLYALWRKPKLFVKFHPVVSTAN
ncbi:uncharacterized protein JN550_007358 [Neoarthrinium moseri]|uniref:uncharacterized protein n=1 Tax=Neoarthrinium moseri TaxID=1658444 RepID=UPI001FDACD79|nr:uncharacterized protein JN550_007358 [Neoarthrinium moseri]KAI1866811.1 hypothetical protein JN550_007358 [Neoarthrinium moseri]